MGGGESTIDVIPIVRTFFSDTGINPRTRRN